MFFWTRQVRTANAFLRANQLLLIGYWNPTNLHRDNIFGLMLTSVVSIQLNPQICLVIHWHDWLTRWVTIIKSVVGEQVSLFNAQRTIAWYIVSFGYRSSDPYDRGLCCAHGLCLSGKPYMNNTGASWKPISSSNRWVVISSTSCGFSRSQFEDEKTPIQRKKAWSSTFSITAPQRLT